MPWRGGSSRSSPKEIDRKTTAYIEERDSPLHTCSPMVSMGSRVGY